MDIYERVQQVRTYLKLSRREFGEALGVSGDVINNIERNRLKQPEQKEPIFKLICEKFHVSESWLRTGEGEMFRPMDREEEIADLVSMLFKEEESSFRFRLIRALSKLDEEEWKVLEKIAVEIAEKKD